MGIFDFLKSNKNIENENGLNETYYENGNGKLRESFHKKDGILNGQYNESNIRGGIKQIGKYKNGKKEGVWLYNGDDGITDYDLTGSLRWVVTYKDGVLHGKFKVYQLYFMINDRCQNNHLLNGDDGITISDNNIEFLNEEGNCIDGVKNDEWRVYEPEMNIINNVLIMEIPSGKTKKTHITLWENGIIETQFTKTHQLKKKKGYISKAPRFNNVFAPKSAKSKRPCENSKSPIIYINTIKDNNGTNIIDCYNNNLKNIDEWDLKKSFINREIP